MPDLQTNQGLTYIDFFSNELSNHTVLAYCVWQNGQLLAGECQLIFYSANVVKA